MRKWTWIEAEAETETDAARAVRTVRIVALVSEWNQIERAMAQRSRFREEDDDGGDEVADTDFEDIWEARINACRAAGDGQTCARCDRAARRDRPAFQGYRGRCDRLDAEQIEALVEASFEAIERRQRSEDERPLIEQGLIEEQLAALGARMMRPYEHHGEHEAYYEYAENSA